MAATTLWHYIRKGMISDETIGPIDTDTLARRIESGEITPDTMLCSEAKTRNQWVPMRTFAPLVVIYERGVDARLQAKQQAKAAKAEQKQLAKQAKLQEQADRRRDVAHRHAARPIQVLEPAPAFEPAPSHAIAPQAAQAPLPAFYAGPAPSTNVTTNVTVRMHRPFNHVLHFALTVFTCGAWFPVWIVLRLFHRG